MLLVNQLSSKAKPLVFVGQFVVQLYSSPEVTFIVIDRGNLLPYFDPS